MPAERRAARSFKGYPDLEQQDIREALEYAAWLTREEVRKPVGVKVLFLADMGADVRVVEWLHGHGQRHGIVLGSATPSTLSQEQ